MVFTCHLISVPKAPLIVIDFGNDSLTIANKEGQRFRINRYFLSTPVLTCDLCGKSVSRMFDHKIKKEYAECPDHARHNYEMLFAASNDVTKYNNKQRRVFFKRAGKWLSIWKKEFNKRMRIALKNAEIAKQATAANTVIQPFR